MLNAKVYDRPIGADHFPDILWDLLTIGLIKKNDTFLDIGGASGELLDIINNHITPIEGTVLDSDKEIIDIGKSHRPHLNFIEGSFPKALDKKYDWVVMQSLFPHLPDWKTAILDMVNAANKYVLFQGLTRETGPTLDDDRTSYFYYMDTGKRVNQTIINIHELVAFLCLEEVRAKRIYINGEYTLGDETRNEIREKLAEFSKTGEPIENQWFHFTFRMHAFRGMPWYEVLGTQVLIELFTPEANPKRMGGIGAKCDKFPDYAFFCPNIEIHVDGNMFYKLENGEMDMNARLFINSPAIW